MIITREDWQNPITLSLEKPVVLIVRDIAMLFKYQISLNKQATGDEGSFTIFGDSKPLNFETEIEVIANPLNININNRKSINYLFKELINQFNQSDKIVVFNRIQKELIGLLKDIRTESLLDFDFNQEILIDDIFKNIGIKFSERSQKPADLLHRHIELLANITKIKVVIITFAFYIFTTLEIENIVKFCRQNDFLLIFIEKEIDLIKERDHFQLHIIEDGMILK